MQLSLSSMAMTTTILIRSILLCFTTLPIKQCNSDKGDTHSTRCRHDQQKSDNHDDDSSKTRKDKTPFRLSLPFP
jgi:hypothetical protein